MSKKLLSIFLISMLLLTIYPVTNVLSADISKEKINEEEMQESNDNELSSEQISLMDVLQDEFHFEPGFYHVYTDGIGKRAIIEFKLLRIRAPIPTPQRPTIFPFMINLFLCFINYDSDENATTVVKTLDDEVIFEKKGPHQVIFPILESPSIMGVCKLFKDGIIDGFAPVNWLLGTTLSKIILRDILNLEPIINMSQPMYDFFEPFWYDSEPLFFDGQTLHRLVEEGYINFTQMFSFLPPVLADIMVKLITFPFIFNAIDINLMLISRTIIGGILDFFPVKIIIPVLGMFFPLDVAGYATPFIAWRE